MYTLDNPVFVTYLIVAALVVLKLIFHSWWTVFRMIKIDGGLVSPEDVQQGPFNKNPDPSQLEANDFVERSRPFALGLFLCLSDAVLALALSSPNRFLIGMPGFHLQRQKILQYSGVC